MTNIEFADTLEKLAAKYRESETLEQPYFRVWGWSKEELASHLRAFGGKWHKVLADNEGDSIVLESLTYPGLTVIAPRSTVCRRLNPEWECDPITSPAEEAGMLA